MSVLLYKIKLSGHRSLEECWYSLIFLLSTLRHVEDTERNQPLLLALKVTEKIKEMLETTRNCNRGC